jgi:L-ascorbate metabolism protein UlaG (beta-lactamase superfamily)
VRWLRRAAIASALLGAAACQKPLAVDAGWEIPANGTPPADAVTVRWSGTTTLVFADGETTWMTDGWFSRPGLLRLVFGRIEPDLDAIGDGLERNAVRERNGKEKLDAIFVLHSHYDHAMDAPEVARRTGATLYGSRSTHMIADGWATFDPNKMHVVKNREKVVLGKFTVTAIESEHFEFPSALARWFALGAVIEKPLRPPAFVLSYKVGETYVLHVTHPKGRWLIVGTAGYRPGALDGFIAHTVLLGIGNLASQTPSYRASFWDETVGAVKAERVIPIHWDSLTAPIDEERFSGPLHLPWNNDDATREFLQRKQAENLVIQTLPRYQRVVLFPTA